MTSVLDVRVQSDDECAGCEGSRVMTSVLDVRVQSDDECAGCEGPE